MYQKAKQQYFEHYQKLPFVEKNQILRYLLNIAIDQYKKGTLVFFQEIYEMFQFGLESKALLHSNDLSSNNFINIIDVTCLAEDYEFAESFYNQYLSATNPAEQASNQLLGPAFLRFSEKDYQKALQFPHTIKTQNTWILFDAKDEESLFDTVEKFRGMMTRAKHQGSEQLFLPYQNYLKMLLDLAKIPPYSKNELLEKYAANQPMSNNIWLNRHIQTQK